MSDEGPKLPPMILLRAFEATARTGSMRRAADDVGISHTVVSRHVRNLEHWFGQDLITAGPRGVVLTEQGEVLYEAVSRAFRIIGNATAELRPSPTASLKIWCFPGFATRWLAPKLTQLEEALGNCDITLRAINRIPNFAEGEADVMIVYAGRDAVPEGATPLLAPRMFPVASPLWIARHGVPQSPEELASASLIHEESKQQWTDWFEAMGVRLRQDLKGPKLWDANLGFDAALAGQGVALASRITAGQELAEGRLVELLKSDIRLGGYHLLFGSKNQNQRVVTRFAQWLGDTLAAEPL
ncbi:LysR substrate-binding domain-containing protein [Devosia sp. MC521]|uniref:LysR substrate-binding domain-containing protein n=1 Tax=Devosia sp. MC521 TaxID=2759954 RepID=UPI0015FB13D6|nr:LysR substrate-binding domain-containing protein [Devosia sp. MC521]MBJ6987775.1 LysR family transcriptional regulator [Devosia sp. MC521]QMW63685.1 LysR family transcriptional regulator [Devosia sp. MC521]